MIGAQFTASLASKNRRPKEKAGHVLRPALQLPNTGSLRRRSSLIRPDASSTSGILLSRRPAPSSWCDQPRRSSFPLLPSPLPSTFLRFRSAPFRSSDFVGEAKSTHACLSLPLSKNNKGRNRARSYRNRSRPFTIHDRYRTVAYQLRYLNLKNPLATYPLVPNELRSRQSRRVDSANSQLNRIIRNQIRGEGVAAAAAVVLVFDPVGHARPSLRDERGNAQPRCSPSP